VEAGALAGVKKKAETEGRPIVFIDESGLSERPHRCRTWAPKGKTPVLQYHVNLKTLSAIAGVTWWNFTSVCFPVRSGARRSSSFSPTCSVTFPASMRKRPTLVIAFWQQADLFPM
jgi:hypothetical protein